ncbi:PBPRA1643 family SWIM/SEC-C metal-binding motif protein [Aliamphritea hakodatensis]|uniref:PBPRA1643 family SWIM/SEC-C metal-binding motif protein n=1 Tax=Aliamphritea hakodatensis TaxID=2895352 RepID=UPI0022FD6585|nr:PBPRA1643 family SWIM/SEC-C metal-binding motif protein [Aliamphritea hakodatensis]
MSKFFFKGTPDVMGNYGKSGYNPKPNVKAGTDAHPLAISVQTEARKEEVAALLVEHDLVGNIDVNPDAPENLAELDAMINTQETQRFAPKPARNEPCSCGSGKKYKKCCG